MNTQLDQEENKLNEDIDQLQYESISDEKSEELSPSSYSHIDLSNPADTQVYEFKSQDSSWDKYGYSRIYAALKEMEQFGVQISIPEFVFVGFQSSGKTSAVSQAANLPVGIMKTGTASRCPTRFKLVNNPNMSQPLIKVDGVKCNSVEEMTLKCMDITAKYEEADEFRSDIIEVRIEWSRVPDLTFVDLPGLIEGVEEKYLAKKKKLAEITSSFLHQQNPDGSYRYIPILVRQPYDIEHDRHAERAYIQKLVDEYNKDGSLGSRKRPRVSWADDTLFIVNKFDKFINTAPASKLIEYMNYCCSYGETVLTIMNPNNAGCSTMKFDELIEFVRSIERLEEVEWQKRIRILKNRGDDNINDLVKLKNEICGVGKMCEVLANKMKEIVTKILPTIEKLLDEDETKKQRAIARLIQQIDLCNPDKLKQQCIAFNNRFLQNMRDYYEGPLIRKLDKKHNKSFAKEMNDFHAKFGKQTWWEYEIPPGKLYQLICKSSNKNKGEDIYGAPDQLAKHLELKLIGASSVLRIIDAWIAMVSFMPFPVKTDQDIINYMGAFHPTLQPTLWTAIRNVVLTAVDDLSDSCVFLTELLRYRLHQDADIVFDYTLKTVFGFNTTANTYASSKNSQPTTTSQSANFSAQPLLERTLKDYKKETNFIIDDFKTLSVLKSQNQTRILSKSFCEDKINLGSLLYKLLKNENIGKKLQEQSVQIGVIANNQETQPIATEVTKVTKVTKVTEVTEVTEPENDAKDDGKDDEKETVDEAYDAEHFDIIFYKQLHGQKLNHPINFNSMKYDLDKIRHLSYVFWTAIKQITIDDVTQKLTNNVMKHITQHDDKIANAIQCGVDQQRLKGLIDQLVQQTGIDVSEVEQLIHKKRTLESTKSLNDLTKEEIAKIYGVDRGELIKEKDAKVAELQKFRQAKKETLRQIHALKNAQMEGNKK